MSTLACARQIDDADGYGDDNLVKELAKLRPELVESVAIRKNELRGVAGHLPQDDVPGLLVCLAGLEGLEARPPGESHIYFDALMRVQSDGQFEIQTFTYSGSPSEWIVAVFHHGGHVALFDGQQLVAWLRRPQAVTVPPPLPPAD